MLPAKTQGRLHDYLLDALSDNDEEIQMAALQKTLAAEGVSLSFTPAFEDWMTENGYDPDYGARPVKRLIQRELVNQLATAILDGSVRKDSAITADAVDGKVLLRN